MSTQWIPPDLLKKLAAEDQRRGFPPGTMASVMNQEIRGKQEYLQDPAKYHYPLNAQGKRIAKHTGEISTAFGPFGIVESTARQPGYGVTPLKDKSIDEQIRFASEYLGARVKQAGSLEAGLAGYGEGPQYAQNVMKRLGNTAPQQGLTQSPDVPPVMPQQPVAMAPLAPAPQQPNQPIAPVDLSRLSAYSAMPEQDARYAQMGRYGSVDAIPYQGSMMHSLSRMLG